MKSVRAGADARRGGGRVALVTGGAGFLGSHIAEYLLASGTKVAVLDDLSGGYPENVPPGATFVTGSILDRRLLSELFDQFRFDYVYHFAAYAAECLSHHIRHFNYMNNLVGTTNLINEAVRAGVRTFVFASSAGVYGSREGLLCEDSTPQPEDPYAVAKYAAELDLKAAFHYFGQQYVIFRLHNVYGERQDLGDRYRNVVAIYMTQALQDQPMTIFGDGLQTRHFSYVSDVIPHLSDSVDCEAALGRIINLGGETPYTILELSKMIALGTGREWKVRFEAPRLEARNVQVDHALARKIFGSGRATPLATGLERMAEWAKNNMKQTRPFRSVELEPNLPLVWRVSPALKLD